MITENYMAPELLKYALMFQMANANTATHIPSTLDWEVNPSNLSEIIIPATTLGKESKDFNSIGVFKKLVKKFESDLAKYPSLVQGHVSEINRYFNKTVQELVEIKPDNIIFSLTASNSLYFRIYKGKIRAHIEVFYVKEDEDDKVEFVCTAYEYDKKILALASPFSSGFNQLKNVLISKPNTISVEEELVLG